MHINKEAKEKTSQNRPQRQKNLIDFSKTGQMLELFGIDFLFRHEKKSAGISYPWCQRLFKGGFRFRLSRYYFVVIVTRTKSEVFSRDFAARDLTCDKCPSSLYVWETRGTGRVLFFPFPRKKKNRLIASYS